MVEKVKWARGAAEFAARRCATIRFRAACALFLAGLSSYTALAQMFVPEPMAARSRSGQFVVRAIQDSRPSGGSLSLETNRNFIRLETALLPVSCERIKRSLWRDLDTTARWQGTVFLVLYPAGSAEDPITLTSERFRDGWQYRVELPDVIERTRYVRSLVKVLLLEIANRNGAARSAEIPTWLVEGFTERILAFSETEVLLPPPRLSRTGFNIPFTPVTVPRKDNPLQRTHQLLLAQTPLTFDQLSWSVEDPEAGAAGELYRCSAHLFVTELLHLENGPA